MSVLCKNCDTEVVGKHCPQCGQKASVKRIKLEDFYEDSLKKLTHWDRGLARTSLDLLKNPGEMTRDFIKGKRAKYTKPLSYLFLVVAASLVFFTPEDIQRLQAGFSANPNALEKMKTFNDWINGHMSLVLAFSIPFMALGTKWFNRRQDVNYAEHLVINTYWMAGATLLSFFINALVKLLKMPMMGTVHLTFSFLVAIFYHAWAYVYFFNKQRYWWGGLQGVLAYIIGYLLYFFVIIVVAAVLMLGYLLVIKKLWPL